MDLLPLGWQRLRRFGCFTGAVLGLSYNDDDDIVFELLGEAKPSKHKPSIRHPKLSIHNPLDGYTVSDAVKDLLLSSILLLWNASQNLVEVVVVIQSDNEMAPKPRSAIHSSKVGDARFVPSVGFNPRTWTVSVLERIEYPKLEALSPIA